MVRTLVRGSRQSMPLLRMARTSSQVRIFRSTKRSSSASTVTPFAIAMPCALQPRKFIIAYCSIFLPSPRETGFLPISNFITILQRFLTRSHCVHVRNRRRASWLNVMARPSTEEHVMRTVYLLLCASAMLAWLALRAEAAKTYQYSERLQHACANDYRAHCGEYGIETSALRLCMNKSGQQLSHGCVNALVADGQVSRAEVEWRKRTGR